MNRIVRTCLLALLIMSCAGVLMMCAQDAGTQDRSKSSDQQSDKPEVTQDKSQNPSVGQQLAHETREAAGEEKDETAQFKQSPSVRLVAKWTGLDLRRAYWLCLVTNFVVIGCIVVWAGRKYLPGMFAARTEAIQKAMQEAQKASGEARRRLAEIELRLQKLDVEIGMMRNAAEKEAAGEEARIQAAAEQEKNKIVAAAEQEIAAAAKAARRQLTGYAADLAVGLAQKQIRVDAPTDQALVRNFARELGSSGDSGKDGN